MTSQPPPDPVVTAQGLTVALTSLAERLDQATKESEARDKALKRYGRHNRLAIFVDIFLTLVIAAVAWVAASAASHADSADARAAAATVAEQALQSAQVSNCEATNVHNAEQLEFWDYLFKASTTTPSAELTRFENLVKAAYQPKDCQKIYAVPQAKGSAAGAT